MIIDRNLIIISLYNLAAGYQWSWQLDKCSKYIDGVIFNLNKSLKEDVTPANPKQFSRRIKRLKFLAKVHLQHCAVLS